MRGAVVCYSGGCDSLTLLYLALRRAKIRGVPVHALSFDYGQRHIKELVYADENCTALNIPHKVVDIDLGYFGRSPLTDTNIDVPAQSEMKQKITVVPYRNTVFLTLAAAYATVHNLDTIYLGAVFEDLLSYPDCRPEYFSAMQHALRLGDMNHALVIETPFINMSKAEIVSLGVQDLGIDYSKAWTCYRGGDKHCGECDACVERKKGFNEANIKDPVEYETV